MYLGKSTQNEISLVDTIRDDIVNKEDVDGHAEVITLWSSMYKSIKTKKSKTIYNTIYHIAIDTTSKEFEILSYIKYKNGRVIKEDDYPSGWMAFIPDSMAENLLAFVKSFKDPLLYLTIRLRAKYNYNPYSH